MGTSSGANRVQTQPGQNQGCASRTSSLVRAVFTRSRTNLAHSGTQMRFCCLAYIYKRIFSYPPIEVYDCILVCTSCKSSSKKLAGSAGNRRVPYMSCLLCFPPRSSIMSHSGCALRGKGLAMPCTCGKGKHLHLQITCYTPTRGTHLGCVKYGRYIVSVLNKQSISLGLRELAVPPLTRCCCLSDAGRVRANTLGPADPNAFCRTHLNPSAP